MTTHEGASDRAYDTVIVGAGPAGCSCALWLADYGLRPLLADQSDTACVTLTRLRFAQDWVLGLPGRTLSEIGVQYRAHIGARHDIAQRLRARVSSLERLAGGAWEVRFDDQAPVRARSVVIATGLAPVRPAALFGGPLASSPVFDALTLLERSTRPGGRRVLVLGGGDNAAENALAMAEQGDHVVLSSRHALSTQRRFAERLAQAPAVQLRLGEATPALSPIGDEICAHWADGSETRFDEVAVLFGYSANRALLEWLAPGSSLPEGIFLAGDVSERQHPCVPAAIGDGAHVARQVERWLAALPNNLTP